MVSPLSASPKFTPSGAYEILGISPSAEGDQRSARWIGGRFSRKATQKLSIEQSVDVNLKKVAVGAPAIKQVERYNLKKGYTVLF